MFEDKKIDLEMILLRLRGDVQSLRMFVVDHIPPCSKEGSILLQQLGVLYNALAPLYELSRPDAKKE